MHFRWPALDGGRSDIFYYDNNAGRRVSSTAMAWPKYDNFISYSTTSRSADFWWIEMAFDERLSAFRLSYCMKYLDFWHGIAAEKTGPHTLIASPARHDIISRWCSLRAWYAFQMRARFHPAQENTAARCETSLLVKIRDENLAWYSLTIAFITARRSWCIAIWVSWFHKILLHAAARYRFDGIFILLIAPLLILSASLLTPIRLLRILAVRLLQIDAVRISIY